jgi:monofunctional biosynthetic peptidoglycan transglycosylase
LVKANRRKTPKRRVKARRKAKPSPRRLLWRVGLLVMALGLCFVAYNLLWPPVGRLAERNPRTSAFMQAQKERWEEQGSSRELKWRFVPLTRISPYLQQAVLIAEDDKFYSHDGFDYDMIGQAVERNLEAGRIRFGASTITQQLAKNLYLTPSRNPLRKLSEAIITWRLEQSLSKPRILELYLNLVEWGPGVYGAEAAARHHFGVAAADLSPQQAARLAAVLPNPDEWNPKAGHGYVAQRWKKIHRVMQKRGYGHIWR